LKIGGPAHLEQAHRQVYRGAEQCKPHEGAELGVIRAKLRGVSVQTLAVIAVETAIEVVATFGKDQEQ
jgi:hypothetical protein